MNTHDPLRTMRDEIEDQLEVDGFASDSDLRRWLAALDAHLAVKRCPACGCTTPPHYRETKPPKPDDLIKVFRHDYGHEVTCVNQECGHSVIGADGETAEEVFAAFYAPVDTTP